MGSINKRAIWYLGVGMAATLLLVVHGGLLWAKSEPTSQVDALMGAGYFVSVTADPIGLKQDPSSDQPYTTYTGCTTVQVASTFPIRLIVKAKAASLAGGTWSATVRPSSLPQGRSKSRVCVRGQGVDIGVLPASAKVKVAEVTVIVMPS